MPEPVTKQKILVVDDENLIRQLMSALLAEQGEVKLAESGQQALQMIEADKPDLVILDVQMPDIDGYEVCRRLKANPETAALPVVFLTANNSNKDEEHGLEVGATDFIRKPISPQIVRTRVANILKLQAATRQLELLASTDPLTGAYNRRHFIDAGNNEILRSQRYQHAITVLMLDIDHFKAVNDTYGHGIGDDALKETVRVIADTLRGEDTLGRIGGEEFAVLLPETDAARAALLAERIREAISRIVIKTPESDLTFTMSIGLTEGKDGDKSIEDMLKRADEGLYQAKEQGRNRVIIA